MTLTVSAILVLLLSGGAFAQKEKAAGTHITVSKTSISSNPLGGQFQSIQAAVNAAEAGQVIEILDESVYEEMVTIDGRAGKTWPARGTGSVAAVGGKTDITIRYVPCGINAMGQRVCSNSRPTIKYRDTHNVGPKTCAEAKTEGDDIGCGGNFETNGALRLIRTSGIKIEGLIIDAISKSPFGSSNVLQVSTPGTTDCPGRGTCCAEGYDGDGNCIGGTPDDPCPLFHGNAAVTIAISGNIQIRDCEIRNGHFGIYVKDRNTGGVFGNPNPADFDITVPLSNFGNTGNHLIEFNKIHSNTAGIFLESVWDLASTIRYNLIYNNTATDASLNNIPDDGGDKANRGGIVFKDNYLTPLAIYNNTFHNNFMHFTGHWQIGYQHLVFNNVFGSQSTGWSSYNYMYILNKFPNRMFNNTIASLRQNVDLQSGINCQGANYVMFEGRFTDLMSTNNPCVGGISTGPVGLGATMLAPQNPTATWGASHGNKWFEINSTTFNTTTYEPIWSYGSVSTHIQGGGWSNGPVRVNGGSGVPDRGAVQQTGKRPMDTTTIKSRLRISPLSMVTISGGSATAEILVTEEINNYVSGPITIKYIRWVAPLPDNSDRDGNPDNNVTNGIPTNDASFGNNGIVIASSYVRSVTNWSPTNLSLGTNNVTIPITGSQIPKYGFFEIVLQSTNANGDQITSDVGFLPFRQLDYRLEITAWQNNV